MRRGLSVFAVMAMLAVATSSASATTRTDASGGGSDRTVPGTYTAVTITPIPRSTFPFHGSDGKYHIAYDVVLLNASTLPVTLDKFEVVDAAHTSKVVASYSGTQLVDPTCAYGDCNRLRQITTRPVTDTVIPTNESRLVYVDQAFDSLGDVPHRVLHRFVGTGKTGLDPNPGPIDYLASPFDLTAGKPRVISPPVRGKNWVAFNGCCQPGLQHRGQLIPANGAVGNSQIFAIDWKRMNDNGAFFTGDETKNESYFDYGQPVYAVADATVVAVLDGVDANAPGTLPSMDPALAAKLTLATADGNHVILDLGGGIFAMYAHLQKGSILVKEGDKLKRGQKLGLLGNTGNASASHLHFQLMDNADFTKAAALPYVFDTFVDRGEIPVDAILNSGDFLTGTFFQDHREKGEVRHNELPVLNAIVDFPNGKS